MSTRSPLGASGRYAHGVRPLPFVALALIVSASACSSLLGIDGDFDALGEGGAGGAGGTNTGTNTGTGLGPGPGAGPPGDLGDPCASDVGCGEGVCSEDGVCCTEACDASCLSCREEDTGEPSGQCAPIVGEADECNGPQVCIDGECSLKPLGADCGAQNECIDTCSADGVCCDAACTGECESCLETLTGMPQGTCAPILSGVKPPDECNDDEVCDGVGDCKKVGGAPCTLNPQGQCLSGNCVDGRCCDTACDQVCEACSNNLSGGPDGICSLIALGMDPENECGLTTCDGAGMCQ